MIKVINTKFLISGTVILAAAALIIGATFAFFSDTETSQGNVLAAGAIDLKIDNTSYATDPTTGLLAASPNTSWGLRDLTIEKFFNFTDLKPGDVGEDTISVHVNNNNAWLCAAARVTVNSDETCTDPENADDPSCVAEVNGTNGDLAQQVNFSFWKDDGDNVLEVGETPFLSGPISGLNGAGKIALADSGNAVFGNNTPIPGDTTVFIGKAWCFGTLTPAPLAQNGNGTGTPLTLGSTGFTCNGAALNNSAQTDKVVGDLQFYAVQSRNNASFTCANGYNPVWPTTQPQTLTLENETINPSGPWVVISDQIFGTLTWQGDGPTFDYTLTAQGLQNNTAYSLIYYADPYPGNNPGKFIGSGTTNGSGILNFNGNPNLGIDLPASGDANYPNPGAKIWLVLSSDYNSGNPSTGPMTAWNPGSYLFEGNVYIHYNDTNN